MLYHFIEETFTFTELDLEYVIKQTSEILNIKKNHIYMLLRICLTGKTQSINVLKIAVILGKEDTKSRLVDIIKIL
jgi:glutamyl/glutaminyl-tRNA synthetase